MSNYSGETSFEFEIERAKNIDTGEIATLDSKEANEWCGGATDYVTFLLQVEGRAYFQRGKTSGLPENCYPDEGEVEIKTVIGPDGKDWEDKLTESEKETILSMIDEHVQEDDGPDPDDYYDNYDDYEPCEIDCGCDEP